MSAGSTKIGSTNNNKTGFPQTQSVSRRRSERLQETAKANMSRLDHLATESFISAIRSFDIDTVQSILKSDFEIEYRSSIYRSVLHSVLELIETGKISVSSREISRFKEKSEKDLNPLYKPEVLRRMVKVILESGRFNVNALTYSSETVLHLAVYNCRCKKFSCDAYKDLINAIIKLLLKNNANINAKSRSGETPLTMASEHGCSHIVHLLLDWRNEFGVGVDLNARNKMGETALLQAARWAKVDVIELLLKHGCLDEIQDHRGFVALHAAIYGTGYSSEQTSSDFLELILALASDETPMMLDRYASLGTIADQIKLGWPGKDSIQKIVSMLVTRGRADINSLDFRGNTVLDLALKSKFRINQKTVEKLMEYGATSGALLNKHPEYPNTTLQHTNKLRKTPLHRLAAVLSTLIFKKNVNSFMCRLNSSPYKDAFEEMTIAKDHRGRTALHYALMATGIITEVADTDVILNSEDIFLLINVLKLKPTIYERDDYGRTPLHYCEDESIYESIVELSANEHIQDIDGKTPRDLKKLRNEEHHRYNLPDKLEDQENQEQFDAWMIWKDSEFAYRDQFSKKIRDKIQQFMNKLSDEIRKRDPRFECRPVLIGSAEEGSKTGLPDEFDFNFILTKLSELCEVVPSPEAPSGFVHLRRRYNKHRPEYQRSKRQEDFETFFNSGGLLFTTEIASRFRILYLQVMSGPELWEGDDFFEWDPRNEVGMIYVKEKRRYEGPVIPNDFTPSFHPCSTIQLKLNRPIEGRYMFALISVDIVPCIKVNGWWPEEALSSLSDKVKFEGCHLIFDQPQKKYPWVPFSDPFARISFAPAEGRMIKECSAVARAAYMVGKQLLLHYDKSELTYVLKTCLLYCIEALKDNTGNSLLYEDINPPELRFFVEKLMLCFHEFYLQDFVPCYMMPFFHLPIEEYLKSNHDQLLNDSSFVYPELAHSLYTSVCTTESLLDFYPPTPEPLNENFNRKELVRKLSFDRSYIEQQQVIYRRVQPESLATGQIVRSDSQSGSQVRLSSNRKRKLWMNANKTKAKRRDFAETE